MPRCSSGGCGACVVLGEIMVMFGRCCCWVHGVAAPRLNLPGPQRQLLAARFQAPKGTSRFLKVIPHLVTAALSMPRAWPLRGTQPGPLLSTIACCIFPYALVKKNPSSWERWLRNVMRADELLLTLPHSAPAVLTCLYGKAMLSTRLESQPCRCRHARWCVTARPRGEVGGLWGSEKQCPAALTLWEYNTLLSSPLAGTLDTTGCDAACPGAAVLGTLGSLCGSTWTLSRKA